MVNALSTRAREDALAESGRELKRAEERLRKVRTDVAALRNKDGVLDAQKTNESNLKVIGDLRTTRINLAIQLIQSQRDLGPGDPPHPGHEGAAQGPRREHRPDRAPIGHRGSRAAPDPGGFAHPVRGPRRRAPRCAEVLREGFSPRASAPGIMSERQVEFFTMIVQPVKPESSQQPRRLLMICLLAGGAAPRLHRRRRDAQIPRLRPGRTDPDPRSGSVRAGPDDAGESPFGGKWRFARPSRPGTPSERPALTLR